MFFTFVLLRLGFFMHFYPNPAPSPVPQRSRLRPALGWLLAASAALLIGCQSTAPNTYGPVPDSAAATARAYRQDAAQHLYRLNAQRIYQGKLPALLYAVGTLQLDIDAAGQVSALRWLRAPQHAPEVMAEIERSARRAAPYPRALQLGPVTYTDTWLWDQSGSFQLDTLSPGQN